MIKRDTVINVPCTMCEKVYSMEVDKEDVQRWKQGELVQRAMPYLSPEQRELLLSGTCTTCFSKLFGREE